MTGTLSIKAFLCALLYLFSVSVYGEIVDIDSKNGVVYFTQTSPNKIIRYDLDSESFLAEVYLSDEPKSLSVKDGRAIVAYSNIVNEVDLSTNIETLVAELDFNIRNVTLLDGYIYVTEEFSPKSMVYSFSDYSFLHSGNLFPYLIPSEKEQSFYYAAARELYKKTQGDEGLFATT